MATTTLLSNPTVTTDSDTLKLLSRISQLSESSGLDITGWQTLAHFEDLSADCFNRPLLSALCTRFTEQAQIAGYAGIQYYAQAKGKLQEAVVLCQPTLESAKLYLEMKEAASIWGDELLESIATAKLAAAIAQSYIGVGEELFDLTAREQLEELLGSKIPNLTALSELKKELFSEAVCLAALKRKGSQEEAEAIIFKQANIEAPNVTICSDTSGMYCLNSRSRAIVNAAVGIANEYRDELDKGYEIFQAVLKIHPHFYATRLAAFYNRMTKLEKQPELRAELLDTMREHLVFCVNHIPTSTHSAFEFTEQDNRNVLSLEPNSLEKFVFERKSASIRVYAEQALHELSRFEIGEILIADLISKCANTAFPAVKSYNKAPVPFRCRVEDDWRKRMVKNEIARNEADRKLHIEELA
jgi:hypothetical protein